MPTTKIPPEQLAAAGLVLSSPEDCTVLRTPWGRGFCYWDDSGNRIACRTEKKRFQSLAIPPVYKEVRLSVLANGHLQALGLDTTGQQQYFYHPSWETLRDSYKFDRLKAIGKELPSIRRKLKAYLKRPPSDKAFVLAALVQALDRTGLRVGNPQSAKDKGTYGLSTLRSRHLEWDAKGKALLHFKGKAGVEIERAIKDHRLSELLDHLDERPGRSLFSYQDESGLHTVHPTQVNHFLRQLSALEISAKEFRTWRASARFVQEWLQLSKSKKKPTLKAILEKVSPAIGNSPAILRQSYIHPVLIQTLKAKPEHIQSQRQAGPKRNLLKVERLLLGLLEEQ